MWGDLPFFIIAFILIPEPQAGRTILSRLSKVYPVRLKTR